MQLAIGETEGCEGINQIDVVDSLYPFDEFDSFYELRNGLVVFPLFLKSFANVPKSSEIGDVMRTEQRILRIPECVEILFVCAYSTGIISLEPTHKCAVEMILG